MKPASKAVPAVGRRSAEAPTAAWWPSLAAGGVLALTALTAMFSPAPASAALVDRGGGLVYDTERDITWYAAPELLPGVLTWTEARAFALDFEYAGSADWLLPLTDFVDSGCAGSVGYGCTDGQMGDLFYNHLGGQAGQSMFDATGDTAEQIANLALFPALAEDWFWSWHTADDGGGTAWAFNFGTGEQLIRPVGRGGRVLMVHAGDLGAAQPVPTPPSLPLVLAAAALALVARPRRRPAPQSPTPFEN